MNNTAAFIMPVKIRGNERELSFFRKSVDSIKNQTDSDWIIIMVEDRSEDQVVYDAIEEMKKELKGKLHVIYSDKNYGSGSSRNTGILYAHEAGFPFILFNDSDDISDPRRLELVRKAFDEDEAANVVYTSFDVIDENDNVVPLEEASQAIRDIINGHKTDAVEGENAWIAIATKKNYTTLTSCTAVRTSLAASELFPLRSVSEDAHTWYRYAAHPGKYVFLREIKGGYRICSDVMSRSRSVNVNFCEQMFNVDSEGFDEAVRIAKKYGTMGGCDENDIRTGFYVRLGLCMLYEGSEEYCRRAMLTAFDISKEKTLDYIDKLPCETEYKLRLKDMLT